MNATRLGGFDTIAPLYDALATLVFGSSIRNAQLCYLSEVPNGGRVLVLGGGTGWLLAELLKVNPAGEIWYVEASSRMISIARSNISNMPQANVHFIHGTLEQLPLYVRYDAIIANFYFDLFSESSLEQALKQIHTAIVPNGKLLVSDFVENNFWSQSALLKIMYLFFGCICNIEATRLPDWQRQLLNCRLAHKESKGFYQNFIRSAVYTAVAPRAGD